MADWKMGGVAGVPIGAIPLPVANGGTGNATGDTSALLVTPTGGVAGTLADHIASKVTAAGGDASATVVTPTGSATARTLSDVAADVATGEIRFPSTFPATGVRFFAGRSGGYSTHFHPDKYLATWATPRTIWTDLVAGSDGVAGEGTEAAPYKTVQKALIVAQAAADAAIIIKVKTNGADVIFNRDEFYPVPGSAAQTVSAKRLAIVPDVPACRLYVTNTQTGLSWALTGGQTYTFQTTRSSVANVLDMSSKDAAGIPAGYVKKASIAEVEALAGSWWQDGSTLYVHTLAGTTPVNGTHLVQVASINYIWAMLLGASAELFLRNVYAMGSCEAPAFDLKNVTSDYTATKFVAWRCAFAHSNPTYITGSGRNGLSLESIKAVQLFHTHAAYNTSDGLNFHYTRRDPTPGASRNYYALLFGCSGYNNGLGNSVNPNINNGITAHEGVHVACVDCTTTNNQGPNVAMVNGCNSLLIGCSSTAPAGGSGASHAAYYFDNSTLPPGIASGAALLDDCVGSDVAGWDLSSDGSSLPITARRFVGDKIPTATIPYVTVDP